MQSPVILKFIFLKMGILVMKIKDRHKVKIKKNPAKAGIFLKRYLNILLSSVTGIIIIICLFDFFN